MAAKIVLVAAGFALVQGGCIPAPPPVEMAAASSSQADGTEDVAATPDSSASASPETAAAAIPDSAAVEAAPDSVAAQAALDSAVAAQSPDSVAAAAAPDNSAPATPEASVPAPAVATPQPARAANASAGASPSPSPTQKRAPAAATATPQPLPAEVVAVTLSKDNRIALIDPVTGKIARTVDLSRPPGELALAADGRSTWVFGTRPGQSSVARFDALSGAKHEDLQFHEGETPESVAFSSDGARAFVAMGSGASSTPGPTTIAFVSSTGHEFGRISVGRQTNDVQLRRDLSGLAIGPGATGDVLFAAGHGSGVVWALDASSGAVLNEIEVGGGPTSVIADPSRQRVYVLLDTLNQLVSIDTITLAVMNRLNLPSRPTGAAMGTDGSVFVAGGDTTGEIWVVDPDGTDIRSRVSIGGRPVGLAVSPDGKSLYIADGTASALSVLSSDTIQVLRTIQLPSEPLSLVDARTSASTQQQTTTPVAAGAATPTPTATLVPSPTPLPDGALLPDRLPADTVAEPFLSGANSPVALAFAPDGRLFYNELQTGKIRVVQNGALLPDPFYQFLIANQTGRGLLGLTLDPDFQTNHYVYAFFTSVPVGDKASAGTSGPNEVIRLTDLNNKGTEPTPVLRDLPSGDTHTSGTLRFGPDGKLYVSLGDDDHGTYAQDLNTLAGKILRINPDGSIPNDNPFVGDQAKQGAVWAYGLHNAASFAFHPEGRQLLAVESGRNGSDAIDVIVRGGNYGWPPAAGQTRDGVVDSIATIKPSIAPTGSTFYTGDQITEWKNDLFYCDSNKEQLRRVRLAPLSFDRVVDEEVVKQGCAYDVVTGPDGALYYSDAKGIYRIRRSGVDALPAVKG